MRCKWTKEQINSLLDTSALVDSIGLLGKGYCWKDIAIFVKGKNARQCRDMWNGLLNPSRKMSPWTEEELRILFDNVYMYGKQWSLISRLFLPGRTADNIKNKWNNTKVSEQYKRHIKPTSFLAKRDSSVPISASFSFGERMNMNYHWWNKGKPTAHRSPGRQLRMQLPPPQNQEGTSSGDR